jgi:hypothetical protein
MKNENTPAPNSSANPKIDPTVVEAENPHAVGYTMMDLREVKLERNLKAKLKSVDPAKQDFSEEFFDRLHNKVMAAVEHTEIRAENRSAVISVRRRAQLKILGRVFPSVIATLLFALSLNSLAQRVAQFDVIAESKAVEIK